MEVNFILFLLFTFIKCQDIYYNHTSEDTNLYFVFTTYRHGARFPFSGVDYFGNPIPYPGALSVYGGIQHLRIGENYRKRYSNFLNMSFDRNEIYIRSSDVGRTIVSTAKELEGLFGRPIPTSYYHIIRGGSNFWNLYHFSEEEKREMNEYAASCKRRNLVDYWQLFVNDIFPILKNTFNYTTYPNLGGFCDSVFTAYFEYEYGNHTENRIGLCGRENATKLHDFCFNWFNTWRGWNEYAAYMFYKLYQHIFKYMDNAINGLSPLKMVMVGGHDVTVGPFIDFLNGMGIISRTHFPHYACNIVIELRKYGEEFYLEFYYNDILKYNNTLQTFKNTLDNSKYSNLYNYCGIPPWKMPNTTAINIETTNINIKTTIITTIITTQNVFEKTTILQTISTSPNIIETTQPQTISTSPNIIETTQPMINTVTTIINQETTQILKIETTIIQSTLILSKETEPNTIQTTTLQSETQQIMNVVSTIINQETTNAQTILKIETTIIQSTQIISKETEPNTIQTETQKITTNIATTTIEATTEAVINKETQQIIETDKEETQKVETQNNSEIESDKIDSNNKEDINKNNTYNDTYIDEHINTTNLTNLKNENNNGILLSFKNSLKKLFKKENNKNLYIIIGLIIAGFIALIIIIVILISRCKRKKIFSLIEEKSKESNNNLSIASSK